jgi:hypothetical protein
MRAEDISKDAETQISEIFNKCVDESTDITSICTSTRNVTSDFEVYEELLDLNSMQVQTKVSDFIQGIVNDVAPSMIGSKDAMISLLYKLIDVLGLQNELMQYHYIIHQQNRTGKALGFK